MVGIDSFGLLEWDFQIGMKWGCSKEFSFRCEIGFSVRLLNSSLSLRSRLAEVSLWFPQSTKLKYCSIWGVLVGYLWFRCWEVNGKWTVNFWRYLKNVKMWYIFHKSINWLSFTSPAYHCHVQSNMNLCYTGTHPVNTGLKPMTFTNAALQCCAISFPCQCPCARKEH